VQRGYSARISLAIAVLLEDDVWRSFVPSVVRIVYTPRSLAALIPSNWRPRRRLVSNSANTPRMSRNAFPAAAPVSTGCSVAFKATPLGLELVHDVLEVLERTRETIDASDDRRVAGAQEVEQHLQFATAGARLLGADHLATSRFQPSALDRQVLVEGRYPGVAVKRHPHRTSFRQSLPCIFLRFDGPLSSPPRCMSRITCFPSAQHEPSWQNPSPRDQTGSRSVRLCVSEGRFVSSGDVGTYCADYESKKNVGILVPRGTNRRRQTLCIAQVLKIH